MNNYSETEYRIVNNQAYTEDNILIYNIFIKKLPKSASRQKILEYFEKFGKILKMGYLGRGKNKIQRCFINFADSKAAARALQKKVHEFGNYKITVQPCQSWYQPNGRSVITQLNGNCKNDSLTDEACDGSIATDNKALIFTLNDDCLEYICKQLPLCDQINYALTCQRFFDIFKMLSNVKYSNLDTLTLGALSQFQIKIFLQIVGPQVKRLVINFNYSGSQELTYVKLLSLFCTNVEKLKIEESYLHPSKIRTLISKMQKLQELEFNDVQISATLITFMKTLKNLKNLKIADNTDITGKNIHQLCNLEKLSLSGCGNLASCHFKKICQNLKNLRYLDIRYCDLLKSDDFEKILLHLVQLETLKLSTTTENFNCLAQLPKLKHLELNDYLNVPITNEFFKNLEIHQAEQLEQLKLKHVIFFNLDQASSVSKLKKLKHLYCDSNTIDDDALAKLIELSELEEIEFINCNAISDKGIVRLLEYCKKLKHLNLSRCDSLTPDLIPSALKLLQEQRARWLRTACVHLILSGKSSFQVMMDEIDLDETSDILKITLEQFLESFFNLDFGESEDFDDEDYYDYPYNYNYYSDDELSEFDIDGFYDLDYLAFDF